jgi:ribokinase
LSVRVAILGYASIDHAMATGPFQGPTGTTLIRRRLSDPWPGTGGIAYAARGIAAARLAARAITWVGRDADGEKYRAALASDGVDVTGVQVGGERTPSAYLFYAPGGETVCLYDPGDQVVDGLTETQRDIARGSDWICLLVGPRGATVDVLDQLTDQQRLAWAVKGDPDAYPPDLVRRILARASVVSFSASERPFLEQAVAPTPLTACVAPGAVLFETRGSRGVWFWHDGSTAVVDARPVAAADTTGAGDTFFAAVVASIVEHPDQPRRAADQGVTAAAALLRGRTAHNERTSDD